MKKGTKLLSAVLAGGLIVSMIPVSASAAEENAMVRVVVENNVLSEEKGAPWTDILVDEWTSVTQDETIADVLSGLLTENNYQFNIQESQWGAYLTDINGLNSEIAGGWSGWLIAYNDCFENASLGKADLTDGDEILVAFSLDGGSDIGYNWGAADTSLKSLIADNGVLSPEFDPAVTQYTLTLPDGTESVQLIPEAAEKKFAYTITKNNTVYKRSHHIPVSDEDIITVTVAGGSDEIADTVYTVAVSVASDSEKPNEPSMPSEEPVEPTEPVIPDDNKDLTIDQLITEMTDEVTSNDQLAAAGNEWYILTLARYEKLDENTKSAYLSNLKEYLSSSELTRATDNARITIALTALGENADDYDGKSIIAPLADFDYASKQGINGVVYTLIALDTNQYEIPTVPEGAEQTTREKLIDTILNAQLPDNGWTFFGDVYDPDMTAMALQALAPYYKSDAKVKAAVDKAVELLSSVQNENGTYTSFGYVNCDSTAQVLMALSELGIDASKDNRFIKNNSLTDGLKLFYNKESKAFANQIGQETNGYSNMQAFYALCSYSRLTSGKTAFYDMSDVNREAPNENNSDNTENNDASIVSAENNNQSDAAAQTDNSNSDKANNGTIPTGDASSAAVPAAVVMISALAAFAMLKKKYDNI